MLNTSALKCETYEYNLSYHVYETTQGTDFYIHSPYIKISSFVLKLLKRGLKVLEYSIV
jgi:hypothetical protein